MSAYFYLWILLIDIYKVVEYNHYQDKSQAEV